MTVSKTAQIKCVEREITLRKRTYPNLVQKGKMTQKQADDELAAMVAVLNTLNEKSEPTLF